MARNDFDRGMDRYNNRSFDREYDRSFNRNRNQDDIRGGRDFDHYEFTTGRDFMTNRPYGPYGPESFEGRDQGWNNQSDMRQNDFGTRGFRDDNFRETRWGGDSSRRGEHFGKGPKGWKRSDERIREEACEALYHDSRIDASDIDVNVKDGTVILKGNVDSRDTKRAAERCVENLSGVEDVQNELRVNREEGNIADLKGRQKGDQNLQSKSGLS